jgi:hypothetical protein
MHPAPGVDAQSVEVYSAAIPVVPSSWLVTLVNEYAQPPRHASGEDDDPYPDMMGEPSAPSMSQVAQDDLIRIAQRLWPLFAATGDAERVALLNDILEEADLTPRVTEVGELCWRTRRTGSGHLLLAGCAASVLRASQEHGWRRLGLCAGDDCQDVYLDEAGRGARRYCSATCLNRARVRAFRSRARADAIQVDNPRL